MTPVIPVIFEDASDLYIGNTVYNRIKFTLPSFGVECFADYASSRTGAAIKRLNEVIELELAGADKDTIARAVDAMYKTARHHGGRNLAPEELAEFKRVNGWPEETAPVEPAEELAAPPAPAEERAPMVTSDGRYTVDPVAHTIEPVEDIPADIVAVMPAWEVQPTCVEFWPRSFDVPSDLVAAFEVEQAAAAAILAEAAAHIFGVEPAALQIAVTGNGAELAAVGASA